MTSASPQRRTAARLLQICGADPVLAGELAGLGISMDRVRGAATAGAVDRLRRGVYAVSGPQPQEFFAAQRHGFWITTVAVMKERPGAIASHASAAVLHGLPCPRADGLWSRCQPSLTRSSPDPRTRSGVRLFHRAMRPCDIVETPWGRATDLARTAVDVASVCPMPQALIVVDEVLRRFTPDVGPRWRWEPLALESARATLWEALVSLAGTRGAVRAGRAIAAASPYSESPAESYSRGVILGAAVPVPQVGLPVSGELGEQFFGDLVWPGEGVIGEVDGADKYQHRADLVAEKAREDSLRAAGWEFARWSGREMRVDKERVLLRLRRAFTRAAIRRDNGESGPFRAQESV